MTLQQQIDQTKSRRDYYARMGKHKAKTICEARLKELMTRKLRHELRMSVQLARAS